MVQEVQVPVHVGGPFIDRDLQAAITLPSEKCVEERECSILLDFHTELDWSPHTMEVI